MNRKLFYIVSSYFVYLTFLSCNSEVPCCNRYDVIINDGITFSTAIYDGDVKEGSRITRVATDILSLDSGKMVAFKIILFDSIVKSYCYRGKPSNYLISAFATYPCNPHHHLVDTLDSVSCRTLFDLDSTQKSGSTVTRKFSYYTQYPSLELKSIKEFGISPDYLWSEEFPSGYFIFKEKPDSVNLLQFNFDFHFSSGRIVSVKTLPVLVKD